MRRAPTLGNARCRARVQAAPTPEAVPVLAERAPALQADQMSHEGASGGSPSKAHRREEEAALRGGAGRHSMSAANHGYTRVLLLLVRFHSEARLRLLLAGYVKEGVPPENRYLNACARGIFPPSYEEDNGAQFRLKDAAEPQKEPPAEPRGVW